MSLADNVAVFRPGGNAKIKSALKKAGLEILLKDKKIDLNAILNKEFANGTELSGGQWQRIALARDMYTNAQVEI